MTRVLITGATGNVGIAVIEALHGLDHQLDLYTGVRNPEEDQPVLHKYRHLTVQRFDFTDPLTYGPALQTCDILFLLRPPQISDVEQYFDPLIQAAVVASVQHIVFLSVQGVENSSIIPHHKIEKLIVRSGIPYTFLRPAYFMQNFSTTLHRELVTNRRVFLPAGKARFTLIDVRDIGAVAAKVLMDPDRHRYQAYDLTAADKLTFGEMATLLSSGLETTIRYESPGLLRFFWTKRREGMPVPFILVMIMLHYLPRFQKEPPVTQWVEVLTGRSPGTFTQYINDHKQVLLGKAQ
ncbi:NmrA family NAD(P)-binding protein [Telluribacter humicola]|uniref:NmrA family NAD(P)-binding protein n=1 Tax=Telluribacter humicola TaxID=1720261 RepID=UPI001A95BAEA|nr:NmrA family NAD(P)-binding protein [Telluribacter humicola]